MAKNNKNQKQLGALLGRHQTVVGQWLLGRPISLPDAVAIKRVTKIPVEEWTVDAPAESSTDLTSDQQRSA